MARRKKNEWDDCINVPKVNEMVRLYIETRDVRNNLLSDIEYRNRFINVLIEKGVIIKNLLEQESKNDYYSFYMGDGDYSPSFALYIWKEVYMDLMDRKFDFGIKDFEAMEVLNNMKIK